ncbi:MAG: aminotransferase class V-fold PLP-dependent enzyme [Christensenellales bacterium]
MIYLDNSASTFFKPPEVIDAAANALRFLPANAGRSGHSAAIKSAALVQKTRNRICDFTTATDYDAIFTAGCTAALNLAIFGSVRRGGHVITTVREHNSVLRPLYELRRKGVISLSVAGDVTAEGIGKLVRPETYMAVVNHVSNVTGEVAPIREIGWLCRERGLTFLVDGAQSVGYLPISLTDDNVDMLAVAPHNGLHAAQGVGVLLVNNRVSLRPVVFGGTGTASHELIQPADRPDGLEAGTLPLPAIASLCAALGVAKKNAAANRDKIRSLYDSLYGGASRISGVRIYSPPDSPCGILRLTSIRSPLRNCRYSVVRIRYLRARWTALRPLMHESLGLLGSGGCVRASLGFDNTPEQIDFFSAPPRNLGIKRKFTT